MPVSVRSVQDPFRSQPRPEEPVPATLRVPQARVLRALMPADPASHCVEWPLLDRASLRTACGMSPKNTMNRLINGDSSGRGGAGLVPLGYVEAVEINVDGVIEINYRITIAGIAEYRRTNGS